MMQYADNYGLPIVTFIDIPEALAIFKSEGLRRYEENTCNHGGHCSFVHLKKAVDLEIKCMASTQVKMDFISPLSSANCPSTSFGIGERKQSLSHTLSTAHNDA
uniref:Uncharacterized protein n=1 Tax=Tanacetum cinerariifolium TaxID=118510 RepID=A0A6L2MWR3_TANCI|nr:hypothetical protein [Tanacetum cinerariifolium]